MAKYTLEQLQARLAELEKENATLTRKASGVSSNGLSMRVGEKGGVSIYGLGRWPVTLFASQAISLGRTMFDAQPGCTLYKFIAANVDKLSFKDDDQKAAIITAIG